ncbi:MAG: class I SAM-dependent methyltransferase [Chthoniobacterales bacterium]
MIAELLSRNFHPLVYGVGAWTDNLPFAYDIVATLRPRLLVELGVDRGESYFTFCQSAAENATGTSCFGIDSWTGDEHVGGYDETTFREVSEHNAERYAAFSTLLRCNFDDALPQFAPESIGLLHIDGRHTESAVRHDVESWLPKLEPGGILLMHDVSVQTRGFGVWKVWNELKSHGRSFTFENGPGLGVCQKPPARSLPEPVETLLSGNATQLVNYYASQAHKIREQIAADWQSGAVRDNAIGKQTIVQVFYGAPYSEENSVLTRIGHGEWKSIALRLPPDCDASWIRVDFISPFTTIEIKSLAVQAKENCVFSAASPNEFDAIRIAGDCRREPHDKLLCLQITGLDPQLYLPELRTPGGEITLHLQLRVDSKNAA